MAEASDPRVADALARFPRERTWLLPALQRVQEVIGFLPGSVLAETGRYLRVPLSEVYGVATDYPEFRLHPRGRHHVRVCTGVTCALLGGRELLTAVAERYGATPGAMGAERDVTLEAADCFFECSVAPLIEVDDQYRGRVRVDDVSRLDRWFTDSSPPSHATAACPPPSLVRPSDSAEEFLDAVVKEAASRQRSRPPMSLVVDMGTCGRAVGAEALSAALRHALSSRSIDARVSDGACNGMCYAAPVLEVERAGWPRFLIERLVPVALPALLDLLASEEGSFTDAGFTGIAWSGRPWRGLAPALEHPFWRRQERVLLARCGVVDPESLDDALARGGYRALARALDRPPEELIATVKSSGLQGRGGAFFPTAVKWEACRRAAGEPKYVVVNGEEGEPGIFKDRHLMEGDPHQLLEGALLAAYAAGASRIIVYVHGEAQLSAARLAGAIAQAEAAGIIGPRVLGRDVACPIELRRGAGGFVLGEETALLESIEGRRAQPRTRPPFPVDSGLWGKPTVINNVETLSAIPAIVAGGGEWFAKLGIAKAPGTKLFGLSGPIRRPGVVEVGHGVTLHTLLQEIGGGLMNGQAFRGAVVGGPSGSIVPATLFDVPMQPRERVSPGTGGIVAVPATASVVDIVKTLLGFNARESCGKCTPCREGTPRLLALIDELANGAGRAERPPALDALADAIQSASLCGLGQAAPLALLRALEDFPDSFLTAG
jgi:NADH-quinone oxidoreductase subunit F